ncbi:hypothetical protein [Bernardetia sp. MNP-M8]|uniref:hypothetical protein n=1 Tax=Bernardetia sp. MNP-M8 TaxID=3127470 RepID=UPI0030D50B53
MRNIIYIVVFLLINSCKSIYISPSNYDYYDYYDDFYSNYYMLMVDKKNDKVNFLFANTKHHHNQYSVIWFDGINRNYRIDGSVDIKVNNITTVIGNSFDWCEISEEEVTELLFFSRDEKYMRFLKALEDIIYFPCDIHHFKDDIPVVPYIMKRTKKINYKRIDKDYHGFVELLAQGKIREAQELSKTIDVYKDE